MRTIYLIIVVLLTAYQARAQDHSVTVPIDLAEGSVAGIDLDLPYTEIASALEGTFHSYFSERHPLGHHYGRISIHINKDEKIGEVRLILDAGPHGVYFKTDTFRSNDGLGVGSTLGDFNRVYGERGVFDYTSEFEGWEHYAWIRAAARYRIATDEGGRYIYAEVEEGCTEADCVVTEVFMSTFGGDE